MVSPTDPPAPSGPVSALLSASKPSSANANANGSAMDVDKLSDYVPDSNDISRAVSVSVSAAGTSAAPTPQGGSPVGSGREESEDEGHGEDGEMDDAHESPSKRSIRAAQQAEQKKGFETKRKEMDKAKLADSMKRFSYLLGQTELFQHFVDIKKNRDPEFARLLAESEEKQKAKKGKKRAGGDEGNRRRKSEKEEDEELLKEEEEEDEPHVFTESPGYVKGGQMRDYQVQGLNWMVSLHHNGINGILADEMGLGKTLQTISFLGYLKHHRDIYGPHLVVVPKSTLDNWYREFHKWVPSFSVVVLQGTKEERAHIIQQSVLSHQFEVLVTSYEMCLREKSHLKKFSWEYIIIDEAHRIKNVDSMLSQIVRVFNSRARLLITGTPLQNNLTELWSLLNFLLPDVFSSSEDFDSWFQKHGNEDQDMVVKQLHKVLRPFLLRRVKADVEKSLLPKKEINVFVGLTEMQKKWYRMIIEKDIDAVNGAGGKKEGKTRLLNIVMQLRKCCNHPYLFDGAEPGPPYTTDVHLINNSGKMVILDKLLKNMKEKGSRVLIFSQMSRVLDILEDYCMFRGYRYNRIDGSTAHEDRIASIDDYNAPDSDKFIFLLTTRAGGLGINLTTADIVVLFDSDWNPQADLQAMDRAHRIGQKKQVYVFRFVTENAVEERILDRAAQKLRLDQLVIQQGRAQQQAQKGASKDELVDMIQHGAEKIINNKIDDVTMNLDIEDIIRRGEERTAQLKEKYEGLNLDDLNNFKSETIGEWEGVQYGGGQKRMIGGMPWIELAKRERKQNYSVDSYYREAMKGGPSKPAVPKAPRPPKQINTQDFQFYPRRLIELQERETAAFRRAQAFQVPLRAPKEDETEEQVEEERVREQAIIDNAEPLTEEEQAEKEELEQEGFGDWSKREFQQFVKGCEKYGRKNFEGIAAEIDGKTVADVKRYASVFWDRYLEIADHERILTRIDEGEAKLKKQRHAEQLLRAKVASYKYPLQQMKIQYNQAKGKSYTEEEDRFLIVQLSKYGLGADDVYETIKKSVLEWPAFRFDWFIKSRTPQEIARRCHTLVLLVTKEAEGGGDDEEEDVDTKKKGGSAAAPIKKTQKKRPIDEVKESTGTSRASTPGSTGGRSNKKKK